jgi:hypothetical protein
MRGSCSQNTTTDTSQLHTPPPPMSRKHCTPNQKESRRGLLYSTSPDIACTASLASAIGGISAATPDHLSLDMSPWCIGAHTAPDCMRWVTQAYMV